MTQCGLTARSPKVCSPGGGLRAEGACTHFSFPLASQGLRNTHHLCLHLFIIIKYYSLGLLIHVAPSSSILLQFPSLLSFLFLACSQSTDFSSGCQLWTSSPPTLSRICFFRNGIQLEVQCVLTGLFSLIDWDHTCWIPLNTGRTLSYSGAYPSIKYPKNVKE